MSILLIGMYPPVARAQPIELRHERILTSDTDPNLIFGPGVSAALGEDGTMYLGEPSAGEIRIFNSAGELQQIVGRRGEGPGEFDNLWQVCLSPEGKFVYAMDSGLSRVVTFDARSGEHRATRSLDMMLTPVHRMICTDDGFAIIGRLAESTRLIHLYDGNGERQRSMGDLSLLRQGIELPEFPEMLHYQLALSSATRHEEGFILSLAAPYVLGKIDARDRMTWRVRDDIVPLPWVKHIRVTATSLEMDFYPQAVPVFSVTDDLVGVYVSQPGDDVPFIDIRSTRDGRLVQRLPLPNHHFVLHGRRIDERGGRLITYSNDDGGVHVWSWNHKR